MERGATGLVAGALAVVLGVGVAAVPSVRPPGTAAQVTAPAAARAELPVPAQPAELPGVPAPAPAVAQAPAVAVEPSAVVPAPEVVPAPPPAPVLPSLEQRAHEALAALAWPWEELGYSIRFQLHRGGPLLGLTDQRTRTITVFVRPRQTDHSLRVTLAHEIGHALDFETGSAAQRARYLELRGLPADTPWWPCGGCPDYASGAGDWAEVFAYWLAGGGDFRSELAAPPDARTLHAISGLFVPPSQRPERAAPEPSPEPTAGPTPSRTPRPLLPIGPR